ncbi:hypothetical protein EV1_044052 [Malus domestica]
MGSPPEPITIHRYLHPLHHRSTDPPSLHRLCLHPNQPAGKGSHENFSSGSYGGVGEEDQSIQQLRFKAASLSFSSVSSRKKMKPNEPNIRIPKSS